jgi:hypothetical protein
MQSPALSGRLLRTELRISGVGDGFALTLQASLEIKSERRAFEEYRARRQERSVTDRLAYNEKHSSVPLAAE